MDISPFKRASPYLSPQTLHAFRTLIGHYLPDYVSQIAAMANQKTRAKKKANKAQKNQADNDATATATVVRAPLARLASSELNQRNGQAQARPKAMARRHRGKRQDETQSDESVPSYGMKESRQRLESRGFHPSVTDMTPYQAIDAWNGAMDEHEKRPTLQELSQGPYNFQDQLNSYTFRILTRV